MTRKRSARLNGPKAKTVAFDALPFHAALIDTNGVILSVNDSWRRHATTDGIQTAGFGVGQNYLTSYEGHREVGFNKAAEAAAGIRGVLQGELREFVIDYPRNSLMSQWYHVTVTPLDRSPSHGAMVIHVDISLPKLFERNLQKQETKYLSLLNSTREGIFALEERGVCTFCNRAAALMLGYEKAGDLVGKVVSQRHYYSRWDGMARTFSESKIKQAILTGKIVHADDEIFSRVDGSQFPVEYWSHPIHHDLDVVGTVVTFSDITEQLQLKSEFLHAQKMEVFGQLAGGVAHDFKNALAVIDGYSQLLAERLSADADGRDYAVQIGIAAERATAFTRQLLGLNRKVLLKTVLLDLNSIIVGMEEILGRMIGENIRLTVNLAPNLPSVQVDPAQIEQILLNLVTNSRDAMPRGGELVIKTSTVDGDGYVALSVSDTGSGMDQATQDRAFEPFFTTKRSGEGTGLGLSTVQKIVKQSGGHIFVHSDPGVVTTFQIYLPIAEGVPGPMLLPHLPHQRVLRGTETILVIEDEEAMRILVSDTLRANGYRVLEAPDGTSGIEIASRFDKPIDLMLTDVVLPDIDGGLVAKKLLESDGSIEVLYMSAHTDEYITNLGLVVSEMTLLQKPFDLQAMLLTIRTALDRKLASSQDVALRSAPFLLTGSSE